MSGQYLSPSVGGQSLNPPRRLSLGEPLPHQLADIPWAPLQLRGLSVPRFDKGKMPCPASSGVSGRFQPLFRDRRQITHVLLTLAPLYGVAPIPFDLHASSTPSAFDLNQDQILVKIYLVCLFEFCEGYLCRFSSHKRFLRICFLKADSPYSSLLPLSKHSYGSFEPSNSLAVLFLLSL